MRGNGYEGVFAARPPYRVEYEHGATFAVGPRCRVEHEHEHGVGFAARQPRRVEHEHEYEYVHGCEYGCGWGVDGADRCGTERMDGVGGEGWGDRRCVGVGREAGRLGRRVLGVGVPGVLALLLAVGACGGGEVVHEEAGEAVAEAVQEEGGAAVKASGPEALATVLAEPVHGWTGPGGEPFEVTRRTPEYAAHLQRRIGVGSFDIALRKTGLTQFPCSSCHPPGVPPTAVPDRIEDAHRNIQPVHPAATGARCRTCHAVDVNMERLTLQSGELATLDQAYRLCSQCHFQQAEAWAGGAHGKRMVGWQGRRVVMNCTDCHDPHRPQLEKRIPFPGPRIPRTTPDAP